MASNIEYLESLPDIDILTEEGISLENIMQRMIENWESAYKEQTGQEKILYPADENRLLINVLAGELFQAYEFGQERFKENFIRFMDDDKLLHWGANLGYELPAEKAAAVTLMFTINDALDFDVIIPVGTRATAGDDVYFSTDVEAIISAGTLSVTVSATCSELGSVGNEYVIGQISTIADPFPYMGSVENITVSSGGEDAPSGDTLKEQVYLYPSTYSVAGPEGAYIAMVKQYSSQIADVKAITDDFANVNVYVLLEEGELPDDFYLEKLSEYLHELKNVPDTDHVIFRKPEIINYEIDVTYYISLSSKDNETTIKEAVEDAGTAYINYQHSELGLDIDTGVLIEYIRVAGAKRVEIRQPDYQKVNNDQVAVCGKLTMHYGGLEG